MTRISLKDAYDNSSVIKQIVDLSDQTDAQGLRAEHAVEVSELALRTAAEAKSIAGVAVITAEDAATTAKGIDAKAESAVSKAQDAQADADNAQQTAQLAVQTANAVDAKADGAVADASEAKRLASAAGSKAASAEAAAGDAQADADSALAKTVTNALAIAASNGRIGKLEVSQGQQDTLIANSVKSVEIVTGEADGTVRVLKNSGAAVERAIPIASEVKTGLMNSQTFANVARLGERVRGLEQGYNVKYGTLPSSAPSQSEITQAWVAAGGDQPTPIGATLRDLDKQLAYVWNGDTWIKPDVASIPVFGQGTSGLIKGGDPSKDGTIIAEPDGTGSPQGWATVKADIRNAQTDIESADGRITGIETRVGAVEGKAAANTAAIAAVKLTAEAAAADASALKVTVGDASKGLVKKVNDTADVAAGAEALADAADQVAGQAKTAADTAVKSITKAAAASKVVLTATRNNGTAFDVNIDAVSAEKAGVLSADQYAHVVKDNKDTTITGRLTFGVHPTVSNLSEAELTSQKVAPVSQIHAAFVAADQKANGIDGKVSAANGRIDSLNTAVAGIDTKLTIGGSAEAPTLTAVTNGKASTVNLPAGGGGKWKKYNGTIGNFIKDFFNGDNVKEGNECIFRQIIDPSSKTGENIRIIIVQVEPMRISLAISGYIAIRTKYYPAVAGYLDRSNISDPFAGLYINYLMSDSINNSMYSANSTCDNIFYKE